MVLRLNGLSVDCIIGDLPHERSARQTLLVDVAMDLPERPCDSDCLADAVDYAELANRISEALVAAKCRLIERAAKIAADICIAYAGPQARLVRVSVTKQGAVPGLGSASVTLGERL